MRLTPALLLAVAFSLQALPIYNLTFIAPAGSHETRPYSLNDLGYLDQGPIHPSPQLPWLRQR